MFIQEKVEQNYYNKTLFSKMLF